MSPASLAKRSFRTVELVSRLRLSAAQTRHYPRCVCNVIFRSHRHELTNTTHDMNQKRSLFYSVVFMSKTIVFIKRYHELKMGHFGEIRLADPVFSAVVLPSKTLHSQIQRAYMILPPPPPPTHTHSNYWTSTVRSIMKQWQRSPVKKENTGKQKYGSLFRIHGVAKFLLHLMTVSKRGLSLWCCLTNGSRSFCRIWACPSWRLMSHVSSSRRRNRISSFTVSAHEK